MKRVWVSIAIAVLFFAALPATAQTGAWTAVGSTGVVDESAAGIYSFGTTELTYLGTSASTAQIVARYNVTNTYAISDTPPWTTLKMGYVLTNTSGNVRARLYEVDPCTGSQTMLCEVVSKPSSFPACDECTFPTGTQINFSTKLYYVQATLSRSLTTVAPPWLVSLRIY